jgi:hypothetical protein
MSKKWYEYLLTVRTETETDTDVMDRTDIESESDTEPETPFVVVPAPPPGKSAVVAAAVTEAFARTHLTPPPLPSSLPIMTPAEKSALHAPASTQMETAASLTKTPSPTSSQPDLKLESVASIYDQANLAEMIRGYSALKVVSMLKSEHLRNMPLEAKRSSILLALEASGTKLQDVVDDALRRIRLLQQEEREAARALEALERRKFEENQAISEELARIVQEYNQRIQGNTEHVSRMKAQFLSWRMEVKEEEQRVSEALSYFTGQQLQLKESADAAKGEKP